MVIWLSAHAFHGYCLSVKIEWILSEGLVSRERQAANGKRIIEQRKRNKEQTKIPQNNYSFRTELQFDLIQFEFWIVFEGIFNLY